MPFPTQPLRKADLQLLLTQMPQSAAISANLRAAKQWATAANLLDERGLTTEGRLAATKDPYLEATVTDWLIHFNLSSSNNVWNYFVYEFSPENLTFRQAELTSSVVDIFSAESSDTLKNTVQLLLKTYTDLHSIAKHKFLIQENGTYLAGSSDLSNPYTTGYLLAKIWERDFGERSAVLVSQIIDAKMSLASILGINREQVKQQLNILAKYEILEQQSAELRIAGQRPKIIGEGNSDYQVYRCWQTSAELLEKAFTHDKATPNQPLIRSLESIFDNESDIPDLSQFLEWASGLISLGGGSKMITKLVS